MPDQSYGGTGGSRSSPETTLFLSHEDKAHHLTSRSATTGPEPSDAELVRGAGRGEHRAWEAIVDRHLPFVNAIARSYRLSAPDREDAVQTVWLSLNQHLTRLRSPDRLRAWLRRVAHDTCSRQRRRDVRHHPVDPHVLAEYVPHHTAAGPESEYLVRERHDELRRAVRRLTDPQDRDLALRLLGELPDHPSADGVPGLPRTSEVPGPRAAANGRRRLARRLRRILEDPT